MAEELIQQTMIEEDMDINPRESFSPVVFEDNPIVKTISNGWLTTASLAEEYKFNESYVRVIKGLKTEFAGWRRVRHDGDSYYRSVISAYILKIFHFKTNTSYIFQLLSLIRSLENVATGEFEQSRQALQKYFFDMYLTDPTGGSYADKINHYKSICQKLDEVDFNLDLVRFARMASFNALNTDWDIRAFILEDEFESIQARVMTMGCEAEGIELTLCPIGLGCVVRQINVFDETMIENYFPTNETKTGEREKLTVNIISKRKGHYDILYSVKDCEEEEYCMAEHQFYIVSNKVRLNGEEYEDIRKYSTFNSDYY
jgi:hypothetical protein